MEQAERITFTAPAELAAKINEAAEADGCSRSEFLRQAIERYIRDREWAEIYRYGEQQAKKMGIKPEDIDGHHPRICGRKWSRRRVHS